MSEYPKPGQVLLIDGLRVHHRGYEDAGYGAWLGADEAFFGDSDDLVNVAAHAERPSDHLRILSEAVRPIVVGKHGVGMRAGL